MPLIWRRMNSVYWASMKPIVSKQRHAHHRIIIITIIIHPALAQESHLRHNSHPPLWTWRFSPFLSHPKMRVPRDPRSVHLLQTQAPSSRPTLSWKCISRPWRCPRSSQRMPRCPSSKTSFEHAQAAYQERL